MKRNRKKVCHFRLIMKDKQNLSKNKVSLSQSALRKGDFQLSTRKTIMRKLKIIKIKV